MDWARERFPMQHIGEDTAGFRKAFKLRLNTAPGVVATGDAEIGPSLLMDNLPVRSPEQCEGWEKLEELRRKVQEQWLTPNDDEIEHALLTYKWLYELAAGFYNELTYPDEELFAQRERVTLEEAYTILEGARVLHACQQEFNSGMRTWIDAFGRQGLDTPLLVRSNMFKAGFRDTGHDLYELWTSWRRCRETLKQLLLDTNASTMGENELKERLGRCLRDKNIVQVCPFKINHAVRWAQDLPKRDPGAIIWVKNIGVGTWLVEALREGGVDPVHCPAGGSNNEKILDPSNEKRVIVASMDAHGTGKNLQGFNRQLFLQWPRSAKLAEQTLGRMHRNGQKANEVWAYTVVTTEFDELCMAATLNDSLYIHQTGGRQKLIICTYTKQPKIFPSGVMKERGFSNKILGEIDRRALEEKFSQEIEKRHLQ